MLVVVPFKQEGGERKPFLRATYTNALETVSLSILKVLTSMKYVEVIEKYNHASGLLFTGGYDIDPTFYGQKPLDSTEKPDPDRDRLELYLSRRAYQEGKPVLGICRGAQIMAVALGASLNQEVIGHRTSPSTYESLTLQEAQHEIVMLPGSLMHQIHGGKPNNRRFVNSMHHQSIAAKDFPSSLWASAYCAKDKITESIEAYDHPFYMGVQWHPEAGYDDNRELFESFAKAVLIYGSQH